MFNPKLRGGGARETSQLFQQSRASINFIDCVERATMQLLGTLIFGAMTIVNLTLFVAVMAGLFPRTSKRR